MKRVFTATCLAMMCAVGLGAQSQADDQKKQADPAKAEEKTVTITGCLRAGDTPNSFVLANVKTAEPKSPIVPEPSPATPPTPPTTPPTDPPSTPPTNPPSTPPTPPTPPDPATPPSNPVAGEPVGTSGPGDVRLIGAPAKLDLAKHVGHTVSISGTFVPAGTASKPTGTSGAPAAAAEGRSFNVKSMTHISETCK